MVKFSREPCNSFTEIKSTSIHSSEVNGVNIVTYYLRQRFLLPSSILAAFQGS